VEEAIMSDLIVAIFPSRRTLSLALDHLMQIEDIDIRRAAIIAKAKSGEVVILDDDIGPDEGSITGGTLGAAIAALGMAQFGALALPGVGPILAIGASALVGGLVGRWTGRFAANLLDRGLAKEQIDLLSARLQAGHPALVIQVRDLIAALPRLRQELEPFRAELVDYVRANA
jgi:uncharacterized membrane protein